MQIRGLIAIILLFSLWIEVAIDPSTSFVRSNIFPSVGKLVVTKAQPAKKKNSATSAPNQSADSSQDDSDDLARINTSSHAACPIKIEAFSVFFSFTELEFDSSESYLEPPKLTHPPRQSDVERI